LFQHLTQVRAIPKTGGEAAMGSGLAGN